MKILVVVTHFPYPENRGDAVRVGMFLRSLAKIAEVKLYSVISPDVTSEQIAIFQKNLGVEVSTFHHPALRLNFWGKVTRVFYSILKITPSWILVKFSKDLSCKLKSLKMSDFDQVFLLGEAAGIYAKNVSNTHIHWDRTNILTKSLANSLKSLKLSGRFRDKINLHITRRFELRTLKIIDSASVTSLEESRNFFDLCDRITPYVLPSRVPFRDFRSDYNPRSKKIIWLGSLDYLPNSRGLIKFLDECVNILRESGFTLLVVGNGTASKDLLRISNQNLSIEFLGYLENLQDVAGDVCAAIVPVWEGAGVKMKTLTLISLGIPVVSTPCGMEGIPNNLALGVYDSSVDLLKAVINATAPQLLNSRELILNYSKSFMGDEKFLEDLKIMISTMPKRG